jgi:hypothetical protein
MVEISLKTRSIDSPTILNGINSSQISGKRKNKTSAIGQQSTRRMHHKMIARRVFIVVV